jgi:hypothetical protein
MMTAMNSARLGPSDDLHLRLGSAREVAMNSPLLGVLIVIVLVVGSTLSIMNKACKGGYHAWCAPMSAVVRHHVKTRPPA